MTRPMSVEEGEREKGKKGTCFFFTYAENSHKLKKLSKRPEKGPKGSTSRVGWHGLGC